MLFPRTALTRDILVTAAIVSKAGSEYGDWDKGFNDGRESGVVQMVSSALQLWSYEGDDMLALARQVVRICRAFQARQSYRLLTAECYECGSRFRREQMVRCGACNEGLCERCAPEHEHRYAPRGWHSALSEPAPF